MGKYSKSPEAVIHSDMAQVASRCHHCRSRVMAISRNRAEWNGMELRSKMWNGTGLKYGTTEHGREGIQGNNCMCTTGAGFCGEDTKMNKLVVFHVSGNTDIVYLLKKMDYHPSTSKTKAVETCLGECQHFKRYNNS